MCAEITVSAHDIFLEGYMGSNNVSVKKITYYDYGVDVSILKHKIFTYCEANNITFNGVYGPPRGGLPIATHLAHAFNIELILKLIDVVDNQYDMYKNSRLLICDDVCDSGETFQTINKLLTETCNLPSPIFCALFTKPRSYSLFPIDLFVTEVSNDTWLMFPWEINDTPDKEYMKGY